ncbi:MAG: hypothetical protein QXH03_09580 [Candidatus Bathyarchaeia archaeon]
MGLLDGRIAVKSYPVADRYSFMAFTPTQSDDKVARAPLIGHCAGRPGASGWHGVQSGVQLVGRRV